MIVTINGNDLNVEVLGPEGAPVLIAHHGGGSVTVGRADWVTPVASAETIAALVPDSRLVIFEKSGHSPQLEEADKFQAVLRDFVSEVLG